LVHMLSSRLTTLNSGLCTVRTAIPINA
jgi:hypothetical protein